MYEKGGKTMTQQQTFGIAAFRSRQQVMRFDAALRRAGIPCDIISTPRDVALGCGLSVRFDLQYARAAQDVYRRARPGNLIGFYQVTLIPGQRPSVAALF
jgi:hypothetical protein